MTDAAAYAALRHPLEAEIAAALAADLAARLPGACARLVREMGATPLARILRAPASAGQTKKRLRNLYLMAAFKELRRTDPTADARTLHAALQRFVQRGVLRRFSDAGGVPPDAAHLHAALYHAVRCQGARLLCERQLRTIIAEEKCGGNFRAPARNWRYQNTDDEGQ